MLTYLPFLRYGKLVFKAKGEKHLVVKQKQPIQRHVEVPQGMKKDTCSRPRRLIPFILGVEEFIEMFVTSGRLDQGLREICDGKFDKRYFKAGYHEHDPNLLFLSVKVYRQICQLGCLRCRKGEQGGARKSQS